MKRLIYILTAMMAAVSCVYPFSVDVNAVDTDSIVIEGDIVIGGTSHFKMSEMQVFEGTSHLQPESIPALFTVEDDKGGSYKANANGDLKLITAPADRRYRLHATNLMNGKEYVSSWQTILEPCEIDSLSYVTNAEGRSLDLSISLHGSDDTRFYQLMMDEAWEYTTLYHATHYYLPPSQDLPDEFKSTGMLARYENGENTYYCWKTHEIPELNVISTEELSENRLINERIHIVPASDDKLSYIYCLNVAAMTISREHHAYLKHLNDVSNYTGSLFSPNPSEMHGNIRCVNDTTEFVVGYIGAGKVSAARVFYDDNDHHFYERKHQTYELENLSPPMWYRSWKYGSMLPVSGNPVQGYEWADKRCVDCTLAGGTKNKPDYWPNTHK